MQINLDLNILRAVNLAASTDPTRYFIEGTCLRCLPAGIELVATDGHRLIAAQLDWPEDCPDRAALITTHKDAGVIIPRKLIAGIKIPRKFSLGTIGLDGDSVTITNAEGTSVAAKLIDGSFPDWRRVMPRGEPSGEPAQFDPELLQSFAAARKLATGDNGMRLCYNGKGPALVGMGALPGGRWLGVVMPLRTTPDSVGAPSTTWLEG